MPRCTSRCLYSSHPHKRSASNALDVGFSACTQVMMGWYAPAKGGGSCDKDFGMPLVNRWRDARTDCCVPTGGGDDATKIECHLVHQTRHAGNGDQVRPSVRYMRGSSSVDAFACSAELNVTHRPR